MYTPEQASKTRQEFWLRFGKYLAPVLSADGTKINWINYKTGIKNLYFRMNADKNEALVAIEIAHKDPQLAAQIFAQFTLLKDEFEEVMKEEWHWERDTVNESGQPLSRIGKKIKGVNVLNEPDWPQIISFLKPRIISLDEFWNDNRMIFEMIT